MTVRALLAVATACTCILASTAGEYTSVEHKFNLIADGKLRTGARVTISPGEITAYAEHALPAGVRTPRLQIVSPGVVTGSALVDFGKIRRAQGYQPGWFMSKILDGERPVSVMARILSGSGKATVQVQSVDISGFEIEGRSLDFLIQNFLLPMYPSAAVDRPFELGHRIEKIDVQPAAVGVLIGR